VGNLSLNSVVPGYLAHKTTQTGGSIFDLVFTTYGATDNEALKAVRYGYEYITHEDLFDTRFSYFGISYAQPTTISTTHIFADGSNVIATRSDGEIIKGTRPVWDKEFNYSSPQTVALLESSTVDNENRTLEWTADGLRIKGVTIRI
jgi:hypothetical protein